jgi:ubiquinone/menaquinone biosynthesis C-methylase UbiE
MEIAEYEKMYEFEDKYWWWVGRARLVKNMLSGMALKSPNILDVGCGTGYNLSYLSTFGEVVGIDFSECAIRFCAKRNYNNVIQANAENMPFKEKTFDLITALDLLEHVDDGKALQEFHRCLKPGGYLLLTVSCV